MTCGGDPAAGDDSWQPTQQPEAHSSGYMECQFLQGDVSACLGTGDADGWR